MSSTPRVPASLQLTSVALRVSNLGRSLDFYVNQLGFVVRQRKAGCAELEVPGLSAGEEPVLRLLEDQRAEPASPEAAGLFHAALLLPSRAALGRWLRLTEAEGVSFSGFADHGGSEAIYLSDPDGNGLEFYADRPRAAWPRENGELAMVTLPPDLRGLIAEGAMAPVVPPLRNATWGHFHLRATNLDRSEKFYSEALGVTLTQRYGSSARFLGADGYHHHLGLNTWGGPSEPRDNRTLGLIGISFARPDARTSQSLQDPDGIAVQLSGGI
jgi:catechol 2,3-dioxygenase